MNNKAINFLWYLIWFISIAFLVVGFVFTIYYSVFYPFLKLFNGNIIEGSSQTAAANFGQFFQGIAGTFFAITGGLLILITIRSQHIENQKTRVTENFFRMIDWHHSNINSMNVPNLKDKLAKFDLDEITSEEATGRPFQGKMTFTAFKRQIQETIKIIKETQSAQNMNDIQIANVAFLVFYHGLDIRWKDYTKSKLKEYKVCINDN